MPKRYASHKFQTPDGPRYVSTINGARVIGDYKPSKEGVAAISELIEVAKKRLGGDAQMLQPVEANKNQT